MRCQDAPLLGAFAPLRSRPARRTQPRSTQTGHPPRRSKGHIQTRQTLTRGWVRTQTKHLGVWTWGLLFEVKESSLLV